MGRTIHSWLGGISIQDSAPVRSEVNPAIHARIADDTLADPGVLVLVVVDADPGLACVVGAEDAIDAGDRADQINSGIRFSFGGFAEADGEGFIDGIDFLKRSATV